MFHNFNSVKSHKIVASSATNEAKEKIRAYLGFLEFLKFLKTIKFDLVQISNDNQAILWVKEPHNSF